MLISYNSDLVDGRLKVCFIKYDRFTYHMTERFCSIHRCSCSIQLTSSHIDLLTGSAEVRDTLPEQEETRPSLLGAAPIN